ncbi:ROK family protein [Spirochaetia bacterium 38H-sp]|uniref:fructokinase n=1 Tax=Rarispira pelagica TaxID=3141764 RepID=A0ABU9UC51_9SPIR
MYAAIEAGGTKWVCAVGKSPSDIAEMTRFPTRSPEHTLKDALDFFSAMQKKHGKLKKMGIGCFGPVELDKNSPKWGYITSTPKIEWQNTEIAPLMAKKLGVDVAFDTDVNAAALAELTLGAGKGLSSLVYITIGTGIGAGIIVDKKPIHGLVHPEAGHILVRRHPDDSYKGLCPFHADCLEGMASGPAISGRWGQPAENLEKTHKAWELEAYYLAQGIANMVLTVSPERIVIGGGVSRQPALFPHTRKHLLDFLAGYIAHPSILQETDNYIVPATLGQEAGIKGAFLLAIE